jgi:hypothetical protein
MSVPKFNPRSAVLLLIIVAIAALRLAAFSGWGPLTVFTPIGAMALFGGAYFKGYIKPLLFPLVTLFISDVILSYTKFADIRTGLLYAGWEWTYLAFALMAFIGKLIIKDVNIKNVALSVVAATVIHWLVSDIGGCIKENSFSFPVYGERLITAIPYEWRFLAGTAIYSVVMFGLFEWLQRKYGALKPAMKS